MKISKVLAPPRVPQMRGFEDGGALAGATLPGSEKWTTASNKKGCVGRVEKGESLRVGTANVGSMNKRAGEIVDMMERRKLDFCALQETRWKGCGTQVMGGYKFFWQGGKGGAGVGLMVAQKWVDCVLEVKRVNDRLMVVRVNVGKWILNLVSAYAPQSGRPMTEKENFYLGLAKTLNDLGKRQGEMAVVCGDFNGHVGERTEGYEGVHGGKGFGKRNEEGEMLLEFAGAHQLSVMNTWFDKSDSRKITYESGEHRTVVDYVMVSRSERSAVTDVTVIKNEPCLLQHKLLVCRLLVKRWVPKRRIAFVKKCKVFKLREPRVLEEFQKRVSVKAEGRTRDVTDVEGIWKGLKDCLLDTAKDVCGESKGPPRHEETWWWNDECAKAVEEKKALYTAMKSSMGGEDSEKARIDKKAYEHANRITKKVISKAKDSESKKWCDSFEFSYAKGDMFKIVKQMKRRNKDVTGAGCVRDSSGKIVMEETALREAWRSHYEKLSNEEFDWDRSILGEEQKVCGPIQEISREEIRSAVMKMKCNKAPGPTGLGAELLKAAGEDGISWLTDLCNTIVREGKLPADWDRSCMINVYKGKGDALQCGSYRGIKLLEHAMKVFERVMEVRLREKLHIDEMQFGFMPGRGTTDAVFIVRQLQEKYLGKKKELWMAFIDLEKAFDRVPREVIWWALRELGVEEHVVSVIQVMYSKACTTVKLGSGESKEFDVKVGVHQGSVLSPLLFIAVMEAISRSFRHGLPFELLYADDLVLIAESEKELLERIEVWKGGLEAKGLRVNMGKTKIMKCHTGPAQGVASVKYPCGVCREGVGADSIICSKCAKWIHHRCSDVKGKLKPDPSFQCRSCIDKTQCVDSAAPVVEDVGADGEIEHVERFCYLGDMIGRGGGAEDAARCRIRCAWGKFNDVSHFLTRRGLSLKRKGCIYDLYVRRTLVHGSETWPMKAVDVQQITRTERSMVRRMCGVRLEDKRRSEDLLKLMDIVSVEEVMNRSALRWLGHVERKDDSDYVSKCRRMVVEGEACRGRKRLTWEGRMDGVMKSRKLCKGMADDREGWRKGSASLRPARLGMQTRASSRH